MQLLGTALNVMQSHNNCSALIGCNRSELRLTTMHIASALLSQLRNMRSLAIALNELVPPLVIAVIANYRHPCYQPEPELLLRHHSLAGTRLPQSRPMTLHQTSTPHSRGPPPEPPEAYRPKAATGSGRGRGGVTLLRQGATGTPFDFQSQEGIPKFTDLPMGPDEGRLRR